MTDLERAFRVLSFEYPGKFQVYEEKGLLGIEQELFVEKDLGYEEIERVCELLGIEWEVRSCGMKHSKTIWDSHWWAKDNLFGCRRASEATFNKTEAAARVIPSIARSLFSDNWKRLSW